MAKDSSKKLKFFVIFATLVALSYIGFLFLPYFRVLNAQTGQLSYSVTGFSVAFGKSTRDGIHIKGSNIMIIGEIAGSIGGLMTLIFCILFLFKKNESPFMYFILGLSIPCGALAIASIFFAGPIYQNINQITNKTLIYSPFFYVTATLTIASFILNGFLLLYASFSGRRHR